MAPHSLVLSRNAVQFCILRLQLHLLSWTCLGKVMIRAAVVLRPLRMSGFLRCQGREGMLHLGFFPARNSRTGWKSDAWNAVCHVLVHLDFRPWHDRPATRCKSIPHTKHGHKYAGGSGATGSPGAALRSRRRRSPPNTTDTI